MILQSCRRHELGVKTACSRRTYLGFVHATRFNLEMRGAIGAAAGVTGDTNTLQVDELTVDDRAKLLWVGHDDAERRQVDVGRNADGDWTVELRCYGWQRRRALHATRHSATVSSAAASGRALPLQTAAARRFQNTIRYSTTSATAAAKNTDRRQR